MHLTILEDAHGSAFSLACPHHRERRCTVYAERFEVCHGYRCRLLRAVEGGEVELGEAERVVGHAQRLVASLRARLPPELEREALFAGAVRLIEESDAAWRRDHAELLLDLAELVTVARRRFGVRDGETVAVSVSDTDSDASP